MDDFIELYKLPPLDLRDYKRNIFLKPPKVLAVMNEKNEKPKDFKYFRVPQNFPLDLNEGYENYVFRDDKYYHNRKHLGLLENYLMNFSKQNNDDNPDPMDNVYTTHRTLYTVMSTPYRPLPHTPVWYDDGWKIYVTRFGNGLYLKHKTNTSRGTSQNNTYAFKLRQFCFSDDPKAQPNTGLPVDENKQIHSITQTQLRNFNITCSGEIQGIKSNYKINTSNVKQLNKCNFVLTKVLKYRHDWRQDSRMFKTWSQAWLSNCKDIYVAFKDWQDPGMVKYPMKHLRTYQILESNEWKMHVCVGFLYKFLALVHEIMKFVDCPYTVYVFRFSDKDKTISFKIHEGKTDETFLTDEYIEFKKKNNV